MYHLKQPHQVHSIVWCQDGTLLWCNLQHRSLVLSSTDLFNPNIHAEIAKRIRISLKPCYKLDYNLDFTKNVLYA